jgi:hypothetical protein
MWGNKKAPDLLAQIEGNEHTDDGVILSSIVTIPADILAVK